MTDARERELERARAEYVARDGNAEYAIRWSETDPHNHLVVESRERAMLAALGRIGRPVGSLRFLDVGCGSGAQISRLISYGAAPDLVAGVDLSASRIETARARLPHAVRLSAGSADKLPFDAGSFDVVLQYTLMSSVLDSGVRQGIAADIIRVLAPGGVLIWYDMKREGWAAARQWRAGSKTAAIHWFTAQEVRELFPGRRVDVGTATLAPWLGRRWAGHPALYAALETIPALHSHHLAVVHAGEPSR